MPGGFDALHHAIPEVCNTPVVIARVIGCRVFGERLGRCCTLAEKGYSVAAFDTFHGATSRLL
jgi:hypothetical protein